MVFLSLSPSLIVLFFLYPIRAKKDVEYVNSTLPIRKNEGRKGNYAIIQSGESFEVACKGPQRELFWNFPSNDDSFGFNQKEFSSRVTESADPTDSNIRVLRINNAMPTDTGYYKCQKKGEEDNFYEFYLFVKGKNFFLKPATNGLAVGNSNLTVPCKATTDAQPNAVTLLVDNVKMNTTYDPRIGFELDKKDLQNLNIYQSSIKCVHNTSEESLGFYVEDTGGVQLGEIATYGMVGLLFWSIFGVLIVAFVFIFVWGNRCFGRKKRKEKLDLEYPMQLLPTADQNAVETSHSDNQQTGSDQSSSLAVGNKYSRNETLLKTGETESQSNMFIESITDTQGNLINKKPIALEEITVGTELLGGGGQADVYKGMYGGEIVAVKKYKPTSAKRFYVEEVNTLLKMRHRNLLQIIGHIDAEYFIILEYCPFLLSKCIHDRSFILDWNLFSEWVSHLVEAFNYLHQNDIIHRDIKSSNVLVSKDNVLRVCDFGVSRIGSITQFTFVTFIGTVGYEAPEMRRRENYSRKVDVYSFGVLLWEMATRRNPISELEWKPTDNEITRKLPPTLLLMISKCTEIAPEERPSFAKLREGFLWDAAHSDIRKNKKNWPQTKEDAQLSADGWNYTMNYVLPDSDENH